MATQDQFNQWHELAQQLRVDSIRSTTEASSGHSTSSMSAADLMAVLLYKYFHYDFENPAHPSNDRFILSKGHASGLLYAMYKAAGAIDDDDSNNQSVRLLDDTNRGDRVTVIHDKHC
jgi:transketolase